MSVEIERNVDVVLNNLETASEQESMTTLSPALTTTQTRYLLAVLHLLERDNRVTFNSLCALLGVSKNAVHQQLHALRRCGFVTWDDGTYGTIRSQYRLERIETL